MTDHLKLLQSSVDLRYESPTYRALGYSFVIRCDDAALADYLASLFQQFQSRGPAQSVYTFCAIEDAGKPNYLLYCDDKMVDNHRRPAVPFATLLWHINRSVVRSSQDRVLIHASAVARGGVALLFPAAMESGKTTLAAGLVREGFDYITDETVAIDPMTGDVEPFPRALSVDEGSWDVLAGLRPEVPPGAEKYVGRQWQVPPSSIRPGSVSGRTYPRFIITPSYVPGGSTELVQIGRAEGVLILAEHSFNFARHGATGLRILAQVARRSVCYRLQVSDLARACSLVQGLVDGDLMDLSGDGATGQEEGSRG